MVEILISFHLNDSFNNLIIYFLTRLGLFFLSLESPNRTILHLTDDKGKLLVCLFVQSGKVAAQLTGQEQLIVPDGMMFLQIFLM